MVLKCGKQQVVAAYELTCIVRKIRKVCTQALIVDLMPNVIASQNLLSTAYKIIIK